MNIIIINSIGKKKWGGGEKWMVMAASGLKALGHNVAIACKGSSRLSLAAKEKQILVFEIAACSDFDFWACTRFYLLFKHFKPDVLIGCQNKDWRVASVAVRCLGLKTKVISRQGLQLMRNNWWYRSTVKYLCDGIITNTRTIKTFYDSFLPVDSDFVRVIYNGVEEVPKSISAFDYSRFLPDDEKEPFIVLSTGRLAKQKGFTYLISAAAEILKTHPNLYFFLAGEGKLKPQLRAQINQLGLQKHFFLLGFVQNIHSLLKSADVFVFSSLYEGMPNSILEAMSHGLPVISTDVNGVSELIKNGVNGLTVAPKSAQQLTEVLKYGAENRNEINKMGRDAQRLVAQYFTVGKMTAELNGCLTGEF